MNALLLCLLTTAAERPADWTMPGWRFRTRVERPRPFRSSAARPAEAAVDFARLLQAAGVKGEFDPASVRVTASGREAPSVYREEFDARRGRMRGYVAWIARPQDGRAVDIYFDVRGRKLPPRRYAPADLPPANLVRNPGFETWRGDAPAHWKISPKELAAPGRFAYTTGERSLKIEVNERTPASRRGVVTVSQILDVSAYAGQAMTFECDLLAERAAYGAPVSIRLKQFRRDGTRIAAYAVQSRWLTIELAQGQRVRFCQRGRFDPAAAKLEILIRMRLSLRDADTAAYVTGPEANFTVWVDRVVVRPGERWPWPAARNGGFVEGALARAPLNRAFDFTGRRRLAFNAASEGALQAGRDDPPDAVHWGLAAGALEFWCKPHWSAGDPRKHIFFDGMAYGHRLQSQLYARGGKLTFVIADANGRRHSVSGPARFRAGRWSHVAATWSFPRARLQLFFDGERIASVGPGAQPWPYSLTMRGDPKLRGAGVCRGDKRSAPMQAFIGGDWRCRPETSADAVIDEFRVSDVERYAGRFAPPRAECAVDAHARALFHFENERCGTHAGDDRFVRGHLACEVPPQWDAAALDVRMNGRVRCLRAVVNPYPPAEWFERNRADRRLPSRRPFIPLPDPRFVAYRLRRAERVVAAGDKGFLLRVGGDYAPVMRGVTFALAAPGAAATLLPRWRANDNVVPFSPAALRATLAPRARSDAERAFQVFRFALQATNYYDAHYCECFPERTRPRVSYSFIKVLNIYPFDQCGPLNYCLRKMFLTAGISSNDAAGTHHQFGQAFYSGAWRLFDLSGRIYWLNRDNRTVAGRDVLEDDLYLKIRMDGSVSAWLRGLPGRERFGQAVRPHRMDFLLRAGERAAVNWLNEGRWFELSGHRQPIPLAKIPPMFGNGAVVFEPTGPTPALQLRNLKWTSRGALEPVDPARPAAMVYRFRCPYILSDGRVQANGEAGEVKLSFSADRGRTWSPVGRSRAGRRLEVSLRDAVSARYEYQLKFDLAPGARVRGLRVRTTFVVSPLSLPGRLRLGDNRIRFVAGPARSPVRTTLQWWERSQTRLGLGLNAVTYYLNSGEALRRVFVARPGADAALRATFLGPWPEGVVRLEGLPRSWIRGPAEQPIPRAGAGAR